MVLAALGQVLSILTVLTGFFFLGLYNNLLFQALVDLTSIIICCSILVVAWNSRKYSENYYFTFIGIAFFYVAIVELAHLLTTHGMPFFPDYGTNEPEQLWTSARYIQSISLVVAPLFLKRTFNIWAVILVFTAIVAGILLSIMVWHNFPPCYLYDSEITPFKISSEFIISSSFIVAGGLLWLFRAYFEPVVLRLLLASTGFAIAAECSFMFYREPTSMLNITGHIFSLLPFILIYWALVVIGLQRPYDMLFYNLSQSHDLLKKERDKLDNLMDLEESMLLALDRDQKVTLINRKGTEILGAPEEEILGKPWYDTFIPADVRKELKEKYNNIMEGKEELTRYTEREIINVKGEVHVIAWHNSLIRDETGKITGIFSSGQDITSRRQAEDLFCAIFNTSPVGMYIIQDGKFRMVNPQFQKYTGYSEGELIGMSPMSIVLPEDAAKVRQNAIKALKLKDQFYTYDFRIRVKDGTIKWFMESVSSILYDGRRATLGTIMDISERKQSEELFRSLSLTDDLTGLYNRRGFLMLANKQLKLSYRMKKPVTVLFADIDRLKWINDNLGHLEGDAAIVNAAKILKDTFREADIVARISGDEFAVFMTGSDENYSETVINRLERRLSEFNQTAAKPYQLSLSFGLASTTSDKPVDLNELLDTADRFMYGQKRDNR